MKGVTNSYYQMFLAAKHSFIETDVQTELDGDCSDYKVIYSEISKLLHDSQGIDIDAHHTRKQLVIEAKLNPKLSDKINESLNILQIIRDAVSGKVLLFNKKESWIKAIHLSLLYNLHKKLKVEYAVPQEFGFIADSIFSLKKDGFSIECIDGYIKVNDPELKRLAIAIDYRVKKLGKQGFISFLSAIDSNYSRNEQRFFFHRRRPTIPIAQNPYTPHGYLFNLFCKYLDLPCNIKANEQRRLFEEIQSLSTHFATILDIDKMSPWANINVEPENIIEKLTEWVLYSEVFYIPQISPKHGKELFPRIFELINNTEEDDFGEMLKASNVMDKVEDFICQQGAIGGEITEDQIIDLCIDIDTPDNIIRILNSISKPASEVNQGYISPFDANKSNIREIPLVKTSTGYVVVNIATYNIAKYRALLNISCKYDPKSEQKLGVALEEFIKESFDRSKIEYLHSVKYAAPEYIKQITNTKRNQGECDFVIETTDYVYLIEVKKKGFTKESLSGNSLHLLLDTTLSFLKSINQLTVAEIILRNEGMISHSNDEESIELQGREIFKLVVSLEDMASLQSDNIKNSLLHGFYNIPKQIQVADVSV